MHNDILKVLVSQDEINDITKKLGKTITKDYEGKPLLLVGLLKGCLPFMMNLSQHIELPLTMSFMSVSSYHGGIQSSGDVKIHYDLDVSITGLDVLIVEDIIDTGQTINTIMNLLKSRGARSIEVVTLLDKIANNNLKAKYIGFEIPNEFVVGYGLDFQQKFRNVPYIGILKKE